MLTYAETTSNSTIVPVVPVSSYAIGPMDPAQIVTLQAQLSTGQDIALLTPAHLPSSVLSHPEFTQGYEWGYLSDIVTDQWSIPQIVNDVYANLKGVFVDEEDPDAYPWTVGELLGGLSRIAQTDQTLAHVGIAYLCFLLPLFSQSRPADWPRRDPYHNSVLHNRAVKAYRAQVRVYREQGQSFQQAQRLALVPCTCAFNAFPPASSPPHPDPVPTLSALLAHPAFQEGPADAQAEFLGDYEAAPLTAEEMIERVEMDLSRRATERDKRQYRANGEHWDLSSYFYNLGFVVGTIDQGLTYAR